MPPSVPRKRLRDSSPSEDSKSNKNSRKRNTEYRKATLYDDLDATSTPQSSKSSNPLLQHLNGEEDDGDDSSLTSLSDDQFEDVVAPKANESDDDDDIEFEDVEAPAHPAPEAPIPTGDLELTLIQDTRLSLTNAYGDKKGPSKRERKVRNATHCVHTLLLLWHNALRNSWLCDPEVQAIMISHLSPRLWEEVERWKHNSGLVKKPEEPTSSKVRGKGKAKGKQSADRKSRDWGAGAERLEEGAIDMSHGDPLFRLMKTLAAWWKQRFHITAPGLRKWGYMPLERLDRLTKAHQAESYDPTKFGERVESIDEFRKCAQNCEGSRDVGAQLFTALLRGLGLESRMVANLQTLGFGWNKLEDAEPEKDETQSKEGQSKSDQSVAEKTPAKANQSKKKNTEPSQAQRRTGTRTRKSKAMVSDDSDELGLEYNDTDDESVIDVKVTPRKTNDAPRKFDNDLDFPHYWTEILSPVTHKWLPVEVLTKNVVGTNRELIESLEPRGAKADKARQITAYIIGYSQDGTAKDVTVRYLKRNMLPGRTKGVRMPPEKVPVYDRRGKVKRYAQFDWFKTAMSGYRRGTKKHPITELDDLEDSNDLTPARPEKKEVKEGHETLQYYKQSKEFVLERHLKREEALKQGAQPVKVFKSKGKGGKVEEEDVYMRSDLVQVKSAETWHKQGRAPVAGEQPLKRVPYRAATLNRRREIMEAEAATGQRVLQGLFSFEQTDWIIPPPIQDGVIPKNEYGNIDLFAEHMCPKGAVHVPYRGAMRVCKRLQIDYAEAVVDFEFGHRMAVPVIQGVVIAEENHDTVMEELKKDEAERIRKEDEKRRKAALAQWRRFLMEMRIAERIRQEYGEISESVSVFGHSRDAPIVLEPNPLTMDEDMAGGFLPEGYEEDVEAEEQTYQTSDFFPAVDEDYEGDDGLIIEEDNPAQQTSKGFGDESQPSGSQGPAKDATSNDEPKRERRPTRRTTRSRAKRAISDNDGKDDDMGMDSTGSHS